MNPRTSMLWKSSFTTLYVYVSWVLLCLSLFSSFVTFTNALENTFSSSIASTTATASESLLVLQDINILIVTDVHSWVAGHPHNDTLNVDYGDVLSLYQRLKVKSINEKKDLFFVMNGDFIDGTGLSSYPPKHLIPILEFMPWDALTIGNHELYRNSTIEYITQPNGFVDFWEGKYLTSNVFLKETNQPIGSRYRILKGESGREILTFGFLYDFQNNCEITQVENVEKVVNDSWFLEALGNDSFDAILVLAHMDAFNPLLDIILAKIRDICGDKMPVQFITGHTHQRKFHQMDPFSISFEAGHYLDTVGFTSLSFNASSANFEHTFIDGNVEDMKELLGMAKSDSFETELGKNLTDLIVATQEELGLNEKLGCSPKTYDVSKGLDEPDSLWGFYTETVVPTEFFKGSDSKLLIQNPGGFRYNLFEGNVTVNDLISLAPYNDTIYLVGEGINGSEFTAAFGETRLVNGDSVLPQMIVAGKVVADVLYDVYTVDFDVDFTKERLEIATGTTLTPIALDGQTTETLWGAYIKDHWQCPILLLDPEQEEEPSWQDKFRDFFESFTVVKMIAFIMTFFVVMFFGWMFLCRHPQQKVSNTDDFESQSFDDGSGEVSYDYSDDESTSVFPISAIGANTASNGSKSYHAIGFV